MNGKINVSIPTAMSSVGLTRMVEEKVEKRDCYVLFLLPRFMLHEREKCSVIQSKEQVAKQLVHYVIYLMKN